MNLIMGVTMTSWKWLEETMTSLPKTSSAHGISMLLRCARWRRIGYFLIPTWTPKILRRIPLMTGLKSRSGSRTGSIDVVLLVKMALNVGGLFCYRWKKSSCFLLCLELSAMQRGLSSFLSQYSKVAFHRSVMGQDSASPSVDSDSWPPRARKSSCIFKRYPSDESSSHKLWHRLSRAGLG